MEFILTAKFLSFLAACIIIESTPGPNMGYLAILSLSNGKRAGLAAVAGVACGLLTVGFAAAMGVAAIISESHALYQILRYGGVAYMLWLAWIGWNGEEETSPSEKTKDGIYFRRGLITNLLNPKAAVFYIAILPGFVDVNQPLILQTVFMTISYVIVATLIHFFIIMLAGRARRFLEDPARMKITRRILSVLLGLIALWFGWNTRP